MRTGLGSLRGFSCEVLEGLTGNSESAAFSTSTCWPTRCGNRLQGTKRLSLFILPFGGEGECLESGSRVHAQMSSEIFQLRMEEVGGAKVPETGSLHRRAVVFFFPQEVPESSSSHHQPLTTHHRAFPSPTCTGFCSMWIVAVPKGFGLCGEYLEAAWTPISPARIKQQS